MALYYQSEFRLGRRMGRVSRSYTGARAFAAIVTDLTFGLTFGVIFELLSRLIALTVKLVALTIQLVVHLLKVHWKIAVVVVTSVLYILTLPFALLHDVVKRVKWEGRVWQEDAHAGRTRKPPDWALGREL